MTSIRPIQQSEADEFLRVLCRVFELDFHRARSVFLNEPLFDLKRKWALYRDGQICSILTTVPLEFGFGKGIGIAGVATLPEHRGNGFAADLLREVVAASRAEHEDAIYLFAKNPQLYESVGFGILDKAVKIPITGAPAHEEILSYEEVLKHYQSWADEDPNRLRRNFQRWSYWRWSFRLCVQSGIGYLSVEGDLIRETVNCGRAGSWPVGQGLRWFGLSSMAAGFELDPDQGEHELYLMGHDASPLPQMFMTDQF